MPNNERPPIIPSNAPHFDGSPWLIDEPPEPEPQEGDE